MRVFTRSIIILRYISEMRWPSRIIKYCSIAEARVLKESILLQRYFFINGRDHSLVGESGKIRFAYSSKTEACTIVA